MRIKLALLAIAATSTLAALFWLGAYDLSATDQHLAPTYWLLDTGMRRAVAQRAKRIAVPPLDDAGRIGRGAEHYRGMCAQCHGAPGVAPEPFALGLLPVPANLAHTARTWHPAELFWTIKHGIKMTGMPAWTFRMSDDEIWSVVAFLRVMPSLAPEDYRRMTERKSASPQASSSRAASGIERTPNAARGKTAIHQYACVTCHVIPGIVGSNAPVGPPLAGIATRPFIAGVLPNTPDTMLQWLRSPQTISPHNAMPDLGVTEQDAADIAAYLATLK
jgi:mono/diheme cytochrome c family protein